MRITLAGYNLDIETLDLVKQLIDEHRRGAEPARISELLDRLADEPFSPETISAAYARISRSEKSIRELRRDARASVSRARQSNERIVFGLGHASVAEHAAFNIDVTDASRLALEELEAHRLASYTEASQRYISMSGDFVTPIEIVEAGLVDEFKAHCERLFEGYRNLSDHLELFHSDLPEKDRRGKAREDARYLLPLACRGQVGMTINARNAEWIIQQSTHSKLAEVKEMGRQMQVALRGLVPSLIKYTDANPNWEASEAVLRLSETPSANINTGDGTEVRLISYPEQGELVVLAALLMHTNQISYEQAFNKIAGMSEDERRNLLLRSHGHIDAHTPVRRELEIGTYLFELTLSASAFAQLKRHRMATLITSKYDSALGVTIPPAINDSGTTEEFLAFTSEASAYYDKLLAQLPSDRTAIAQYALTNAHRRRVLFQASARELSHLSRLREDEHAQWDIRRLAGIMTGLARKATPGMMLFATGKDKFESVLEEIKKSVAEMK